MSLEQYFCSSPWIHVRITSSGNMEFCRWADYNNNTPTNANIRDIDLNDFFSNNLGLSKFRLDLLNGKKQSICNKCYQMEAHGKVSGRDRQLLKIGVFKNQFLKSLKSSPYNTEFVKSRQNLGKTDQYPIDWQIDLGNYCNSSCVFCNPESSSKLLSEFKKIGILNQQTKYKSWADDNELVDKFSKYLSSLPKIQYLHFIGGETLITPAFKKIIRDLVDSNVSSEITLGFTTNLTVWDNEIIDLFKKFKQINVGLSVETLTKVNDYVRYPSKIDQVKKILDRWVLLSKQNNWLVQLRITPTCLSINDLITVYDYALEHQLSIESCNFLENPAFLRPTVLPMHYRKIVIEQINNWLSGVGSLESPARIVNTRNPETAKIQLLQDAESYVNYLNTAADESHRLPELVAYLKKLESNRNNSILDYLPEYYELFRSAGY